MGDVAVALIGADMAHARAQRRAPDERLALIAGMAEIERVGDLRKMPAHQRGISAETVAGEDQMRTADPLATPVGAHGAHAEDPPRFIRIAIA